MNKNILVILVLLGIIYWLFCSDNNEQFAQSNPYNDKGLEDNQLYEIGEDDSGLPIYSYNGKEYVINKDNELEELANDTNDIKYESVAVRIPAVITSKKVKSQVPLTFKDYKFKGLISNEAYKQYYILYEKEYENYQMENKLYQYVLVKKIDNEYKVVYDIPPRERVNEGDTMVFSYANFQIGPLKFV